MINLILGFTLGLFAAFLFNVGALIQKHSLNEISDIKLKTIKNSIKEMINNKKFLLGFLMEALGGVIHKIAINYGGISLVQPLLSVGFVFLAIFSKKITNESIDIKTGIGIFSLILTPFFIMFSEIMPPNIEIVRMDILMLFFTTIFLIVLINLVFILIAKKIVMIWIFITSIWLSLGAFCLQGAFIFIKNKGLDLILDLKVLISLLFGSTDFLFVWILFGLTGIFDTLGWFSLQIGLQKNPAAQFVPIVLTLYTIIPVLGGVIIFNQIIGNFSIYIIGIIFASIGTLILGKYKIIKEKTF